MMSEACLKGWRLDDIMGAARSEDVILFGFVVEAISGSVTPPSAAMSIMIGPMVLPFA